MHRLLLILLAINCPSFSWGQSKSELSKYEYAKELIQAEKYVQAQTVLDKIVESGPEKTPLYYNSSYLQALSKYKQGKSQEAREQLFKLSQQHPEWSGIDDVSFLMGTIDFEWGMPEQALKTLGSIENPQLQQEAYHLCKSQLAELGVAQLKQLRPQFPDNEALGRVLLGKLYKEGNWEYEMPLIEKLEARYNTSALSAAPKENALKAQYNIGVMMPFNYQQISTSNPQANFVLDIYEGMKVALAQLNQMGANIKLHAFDTKRDANHTIALLNDPELQKLDLIVGPIYPETIKPVQAFSAQTGIPMVNPLREEHWVAPDSIPSYAFSSDIYTQAAFASEFAFHEMKSLSSFIVYGNKERDLLMAQAYRAKMESLGGEVVKAIQFTYDEESYKSLRAALEPIVESNNAHVFVTSKELTVANTLISALQSLESNASILAPQRWMEIPQLSFSRMESANVKFYYPLYFDENSKEAKAFQEAYRNATNIHPSKYSHIGYGALYSFGRLLQKYGTKFPEAMLDDTPNALPKAPMFGSPSFMGNHDNQAVYIGAFTEGVFNIIYPAGQNDK